MIDPYEDRPVSYLDRPNAAGLWHSVIVASGLNLFGPDRWRCI